MGKETVVTQFEASHNPSLYLKEVTQRTRNLSYMARPEFESGILFYETGVLPQHSTLNSKNHKILLHLSRLVNLNTGKAAGNMTEEVATSCEVSDLCSERDRFVSRSTHLLSRVRFSRYYSPLQRILGRTSN